MAPQENSIGNADPSSMADPAHHSSADESHTMTDGEKPTKLVDVIMDPDFLPTTAKAPLLRKIQAYGVLLVLVMGGMVGARTVLGIEILQTPMHTFVATGVVVAGAILAITGDIDWWGMSCFTTN